MATAFKTSFFNLKPLNKLTDPRQLNFTKYKISFECLHHLHF